MGYKFKVFLVDDEVGELDFSENKPIQPGLHYGENKVIPTEWLENKREELEKEYYDLFYAYTDKGVNKQVQVLDDLNAFKTVLKYWEEEINKPLQFNQ